MLDLGEKNMHHRLVELSIPLYHHMENHRTKGQSYAPGCLGPKEQRQFVLLRPNSANST